MASWTNRAAYGYISSWEGDRGKEAILIEVFGEFSSEMPAEDDVTNPHRGQARGAVAHHSSGSSFWVRGAKASLALAAECGQAREDLKLKRWKC